MSFIKCIDNLAAEGILPKEKQINIEQLYLENLQKALDAGANETEAARLAGKATFESFQYNALRKQRITSLQNIAVNRAKNYILNEYKNMKNKIDPPEALKRIVGFLEVPEGTTKFANVEVRTRVVRGELHNNMYAFLKNHRHTLLGNTRNKADLELIGQETVSYTHLTLPTILLV